MPLFGHVFVVTFLHLFLFEHLEMPSHKSKIPKGTKIKLLLVAF